MGLAAAVEAARESRRRSARMEITVYEASDRVGKSILATGNGRCNLSNSAIDAAVYRKCGSSSAKRIGHCRPRRFDPLSRIWAWSCVEEAEGRIYPLTNKATSVLDALRASPSAKAACANRAAPRPLPSRPSKKDSSFALPTGARFSPTPSSSRGGGPAQRFALPHTPMRAFCPCSVRSKQMSRPSRAQQHTRVLRGFAAWPPVRIGR